MKRLFLGINIPTEVKNILQKKQQEIENTFDTSPIRWVNKENMHITLYFLGLIKGDILTDIIKELQTIDANSFVINLNKISYFPQDRRNATMVWVKGDSNELEDLRKQIIEKINKKSLIKQSHNDINFFAHITLGRIRKWEWKQISLYNIPIIEEDINVQFTVNSFEIMESKLHAKGPIYDIIHTIPFKIVKYEK